MISHKHTKTVLAFFWSFALLVTLASAQETRTDARRAWLTVIATTDLHGNILPVDYYTNKEDARGLARVATIVRQIRKENPNTVLVDSGDTIQGTPLAFFHNRKNNTPPDPMMLTMSALKYDALAVGNHEYNFGLKVLNKAKSEAAFPWLSGNTYKKGTNETYYRPYIVKEIGGVRVGILGLTTPGVPNWDNPENFAGLEFREPLPEARKWVNELKTKERADVVVVAMHMGLEEDLRTGESSPGQVPFENQAMAIARGVPGIDVITMGHTHRDIPSVIINGVLLTQANAYGRHVARVDLYLQKGAQNRWQIAARTARTIPITDRIETDAEIARLAAPTNAKRKRGSRRVIGNSPAELTADGARFSDNALLDLIHRVQLDAGKADVSMAASFNDRARVAQGDVTVRDIAGLYVYENTLVVLEVTGQQLKDALEHSARYFTEYRAGAAPADLVDAKIPGYNFDIAEGVAYDLDITKPFGSRIRNLQFKGKPLAPTQKLKLATNNYRVNGGGGYTMYKGAPVIYRSGEEIRELIIDWVERNKQIPAQATNNWRLVAR
jgi:2',3'-cyclic-nucleotide 2'-phosphodiesterase/3'-nucleotidase